MSSSNSLLRHRRHLNDQNEPLVVDCLLHRGEMIFDDHPDELNATTEMHHNEVAPATSTTQGMWICEPVDDSVGGAIYRILDLPEEVQNGIRSSADDTVLRTTGCTFEAGMVRCNQASSSSMRIISSEESSSPSSRRKLQSSGTLRAGVLRISTNDSSPRNTALETQQLIFQDQLSVNRQLQRCSGGLVSVEPLAGSTGIFDVDLDVSIVDYQYDDNALFSLINMATDQANIDHEAVLGGRNLRRAVDLFMVQIPAGSGRWAAFAVIGGTLSAYNDEWITYLGAQAHEIGHNMGLDHAYEDGLEYRATAGYMGSAPRYVRGPQRCFNAANYWALEWHRDRALEMQWGSGAPTSRQLNIAGVVDYSTTIPGEWTVVKVTEDIFISYNRAKSFNFETDEYPDRLLVVEQYPDNKGTNLLAALRVGDDYKTNVGGRELKIEVCFERSGGGTLADTLRVGVGYDRNVCGSSIVIATGAPTPVPTQSPTPGPTPTFTAENSDGNLPPSVAPVSGPTPAPTPTLFFSDPNIAASTGRHSTVEKEAIYEQPIFMLLIGACALFCCLLIPFIWCMRRDKRVNRRAETRRATAVDVVKEENDSRSVSTSSDDSDEFKDEAPRSVLNSKQLRTDTRRHPYMASSSVPRRASPRGRHYDRSMRVNADGRVRRHVSRSPRRTLSPSRRRASPPAPYVKQLTPARMPPMEETSPEPYPMRNSPNSDLLTREMYRRSVRQALAATEPKSNDCCSVAVTDPTCWNEALFCTRQGDSMSENSPWWSGWFT